jgi:MYXO-CTERM domain-containing protein
MTKNGKTVVIGVHSFTTTQTCNGDGDDTRVDKYTSFVEDAIKTADPGFLSGGCNASAGRGDFAAIALALAALARRKKSR